LSGTPTANGLYAFTIVASNGVTLNAIQLFALTVAQPPAITSANNVTFVEGIPNSFTLTGITIFRKKVWIIAEPCQNVWIVGIPSIC